MGSLVGSINGSQPGSVGSGANELLRALCRPR